MFEVRQTGIPGCVEIHPTVSEDKRGRFVKVFHRGEFRLNGWATNFAEEYYSTSVEGVLRGLHFQVPPRHHVKLVYCTQGTALDAVLDLRLGSPTFGKHALIELSAQRANCVYIPRGLAHGFCVASGTATLVYKVTTVYDPAADTGVLWSSAGIPWPVKDPIVSSRDAALPPLSNFLSPFSYE